MNLVPRKLLQSALLIPVSSLIAENGECSTCTSQWVPHHQDSVITRTFWDLPPLSSFEIHSVSPLVFLPWGFCQTQLIFEGFICILEYAAQICLIVLLKMKFAGCASFSYALVLFSGVKGQVCDLNVHTESSEIEIFKKIESKVSKSRSEKNKILSFIFLTC